MGQMYSDWQRERGEWTPQSLEEKERTRKELKELVRDYIRSGGKIETVGVIQGRTITRRAIKKKYGVDDNFINECMRNKKFPIALHREGSGRDRRARKILKEHDKFEAREIEVFFDNKLYELDGYERIFTLKWDR